MLRFSSLASTTRPTRHLPYEHVPQQVLTSLSEVWRSSIDALEAFGTEDLGEDRASTISCFMSRCWLVGST